MAEPICWVCDAPIHGTPVVLSTHATPPTREVKAHRPCAIAWCEDDDGEIYDLRTKACADGHHRYPGSWKANPADPYGDARLWECAKGCGHVQRAPGYGVGRFLAEHEGALFGA